jgi:hypothetical protein
LFFHFYSREAAADWMPQNFALKTLAKPAGSKAPNSAAALNHRRTLTLGMKSDTLVLYF